MLVAMLLGCSTPQNDPLPGGADSSGAALDTAPETGPPLLTPEAVIEQLDAFFAVGLPSPAAVRAAYVDILEHGDADCPGGTTEVLTPPEGCTSEEGYWFSGLASIQDGLEGGGGEEISGWSFSGEFEIIDPEGRVFGAGGSIGSAHGDNEQGSFIASTMGGTWSLDDGPAFLDAGFSGLVEMNMNQFGEDFRIGLDGAVSYGNTIVVSFSEVVASAQECREHLLGVMQVRDAHGRWYQVEMSDCTGCGMVSQDGQVLGEGCMKTVGIPERIVTTLQAEL